jgi:multisubunit Na+/H+ antiporter MnhC subunit
MKGKSAPILDSAVGVTDVANKITDPLPQALVLTAIVIGLGVTALMLTYAMKLHKERGTLEIGSYEDLKW